MGNQHPSGEWSKYEEWRIARVRGSKQISPQLIETALASPRDFAEWLKRHDPEAVLGDLYTPDNSPLANFLWDTLGVHIFTAGEIAYNETLISMPGWCMAFDLATIDYAETRPNEDTKLRAWELLKVLQMVNEGNDSV